MTVLLGEAAADFFTERGPILRKGHGTEDAFKTHEWMIRSCSTALEHIVAVFAFHNNGISAIGGLACLAKATLEFGKRDFHAIRLSD